MPTRFSDQQNTAGWRRFEPMWDEFEATNWTTPNGRSGCTGGRAVSPHLFSDKNVTVSDGKLHLTMRKEKRA